MKLLEPDDPAPLSAGERFKYYVMQSVGPQPILTSAAVAGVQQAGNDPHEWGQGGEGFGTRFGSNMGFTIVRQTITYGLSEALHEDNRYFASGRHSTWGRIEYALISPATARKRDGHRTVSISSLTGMAGAATISLAWYPPSWQGADRAARNFAITYGAIAGINVVREFTPDLIRRLRR